MALYTADSKEKVRDAVDMTDLVGSRVELRRSGPTRYEGLCPFHEERTPSFGINPAEKLYHCFGCKASGDCFTWVMEIEGLDFKAALEYLADRYGVELEREEEDPAAAARREHRERLHALLERTAAYYVRVLWESREASKAREYLAARGLEERVLREFRVGYAPSAWDKVMVASMRSGFTEAELYAAGLGQRSRQGSFYDRFRARIMFPLSDMRGRVLGFGARAMSEGRGPKYVNTSDGELYHKGRQLFGADLARAPAAKAGSVIVVEGYTDVLALHQAGLRNCVGIMGTALTEDQVAVLARMAPRVVLALDADSAGQEAMLRAARVAAGRNLELRVVPMPEGADPADLVARDGADAVRERLEGSVPFVRFRVERALAGADVSNAEGKDRVLAEVGPVLRGLPPSAMREELVRLVAGRLELSEHLVAQLAAAAASSAGGREGSASSSEGRSERPASITRAPAPLDRREQSERSFLVLCIALPDAGREALRAVDPEEHFTSPLVRRAVLHLRDRVATPLADLPEEDPELVALISELVVRAGSEPASIGTLDVQKLQLEHTRLERAIKSAQSRQEPAVVALAEERERVLAQLREALG